MAPGGNRSSTDTLLDRAVHAINRGDRAAADALAGRVLKADSGNADAGDLLAAPQDPGEIRRLTIMFADLVDSTALSRTVEPETYWTVVGRYREQVVQIVNRYDGHIAATKGDGLLAVFGYPRAHDNSVQRGVTAGLEIARAVADLSQQTERRFGFTISARVGVHRGVVYLDTVEDDIYGLAANLAQRVSALAPPGSMVVSDVVASLVADVFELEARPPARVKGIDELVVHHLVLGERASAVGAQRAGRSPLVGRVREVARLEKAWARAQNGNLKTPGVVFRGEPGIGKSRLVSAATELAQQSGGAVLEVLGSPFHTDAGLHPIRQLLERRCGIGRMTDQPERLRLLRAEIDAQSLDTDRVVSLLAPVLGIAAEHGYTAVPAEGQKLYDLIASAVVDYLLACIGSGAGLIVADDVQWFDPSTLEILESLLTGADGKLLVVMAGRLSDWLSPAWPVKVLELQPLTEDEADELILGLDPTLERAGRAEVHQRCDGIPFYLEQVVGELTNGGVPEALYDSLFARLRASANVVPVVEAAGVIGRNVDRGILATVCTLDENELDDVIDVLEDALVFEASGIDSWRFRHELLREVAYELAPPTVRRGLHAQVADALIDNVGGEPDWRLVAGHYEQAMRPDDAASAYQHASAAARRRGALPEACAYLSLMITQLDLAAPGPDRDRREVAARLERGLLIGAAEGHSSPAAAADFERCLQLGGTDVNNDDLAATLAALMGYYAVRADLRRARPVGELLRAGLGEDRQWFRPAVDALFGVITLLGGEFSAAQRHLEDAVADPPEDDQQVKRTWFLPNDPLVSAHVNLAVIHMLRGDLDEADAMLRDGVARAEGLDFPQGAYSLGYARFINTWVCIEAGELELAAELAANLAAFSDRHGFDQWRLVADVQASIITARNMLDANEFDADALAAAIAKAIEFIGRLLALELAVYGTSFAAQLARLMIDAGEPEQARMSLNAAMGLSDETGMHFYDAELLRLRAQTAPDDRGRFADLNAALDLARAQGTHVFELRAAMDDVRLRGERGRATLIAAVERFPATNRWPELAEARKLLAHKDVDVR